MYSASCLGQSWFLEKWADFSICCQNWSRYHSNFVTKIMSPWTDHTVTRPTLLWMSHISWLKNKLFQVLQHVTKQSGTNNSPMGAQLTTVFGSLQLAAAILGFQECILRNCSINMVVSCWVPCFTNNLQGWELQLKVSGLSINWFSQFKGSVM